MLKNLKIIALIFIFLVSLTSLLYAQQVQQQQRRPFNRELNELMRLIQDLNELEKDKKVSITKDQAKKLIPILQDIMKRNTLPPKEAEKFIIKIENVLTDAQITFLDKLQIERQERMRQLRQQWEQQQAQGGQNVRPQNPPNRQIDKDMEKVFQAWMQGKPLNPYYHVKSFKDRLNEFIERLKKK